MQVYLNLGSNVEVREHYLSEALKHIHSLPSSKIMGISRLYETPAVELEEDNPKPFLNMCVALRTSLRFPELLKKLQEIEEELGRNPKDRGKARSRPIDIDIVSAEHRIVEKPELKVPHPRLTDRSFFLWPLLEICPNACDPKTGLPLRHFLLSAYPPIARILPALKL